MNERKNIQLIEVPYHIGYVDEGMAQGPEQLLGSGILEQLNDTGIHASHLTVHRPDPVAGENEAILAVNKLVRDRVREALRQGAFPLIVSGGCSASLGALAGLDSPTTGILWFDAHGDYNTPETTPSGYFGGMPLAVANGLGHPDHWRGLTDQAPVPGAHTLLVGVRDLDPGEVDNLQISQVTLIDGEACRDQTASRQLLVSLDILKNKVDGIYLHLDIDVLDPTIAPGVTYPSPEGMRLSQLIEMLEIIGRNVPVSAASLTAFNPAEDIENRTLKSAQALLMALARSVVG